ncbi:MAG: Lrp/AsnC family transcriptional regulator [Rhodospirillales bacterium]|nr:Lrp/AsnC family transcriptional regulator [Rhodospirillales bacterium]
MPKLNLDAIDRRILEALQRNGRLTNVELAKESGLSQSPCLRRIKILEDKGIIEGYRAVLNRERVGLGVTVFVSINLQFHSDKDAAVFTDATVKLPEVIACHNVSGETDFLLEVVAQDLRTYSELVLTKLLALPGIKDIRSNFSMKTVKSPAPLPLDHIE